MGLFRFLGTELIDIVEWPEAASNDVMAHKFQRHDNEIKNGAKLIVREGQVAVFVNMGQLADVFTPGMYTLSTKNLPILSTLMGWKYGFDSPFKAEVYFISTRRFMDLKWGTSNPIIMRDKEFGMVRIRAYGSYAIQITDPQDFLREVLATDPSFTTFEIAEQLRKMIVSRFSDAAASSGIGAIDMAANLDELGKVSKEKISGEFGEMGISVPIFIVENISLPPNVEKALDKRTSMGMLGNMQQYMQYQAAESLEKAAENTSGGAAGAAMGIGAGFGLGQQFVNMMQQPMAAAPAAPPPTAPAAPAPPPLPAAVSFWVGINGQQQGPFDLNQLGQQIAAGQLQKDTLVWRQGMASWEQAGKVAEFTPLFPAAPPPMPG